MINDLFVEFKQFVKIGKEYFCVKENCENCQFVDKCQNETQSICVSGSNPIRECISAKTQSNNDLYPNNKIVLKEVKNPHFHKNADYVVYDTESQKYYCLNQQCKDCRYQIICDKECSIIEDRNVILSLDFKNQEPRIATLMPRTTNNKECEWECVFANDSIRMIGKPYNTLELLFKMQGIDTSINNERFNSWIDFMFFKDKTELYELQTLTNIYFKTQSQKDCDKLKAKCEYLLKSYNDFID